MTSIAGHFVFKQICNIQLKACQELCQGDFCSPLEWAIVGSENLRISGEEPTDGWCRRKKGISNADPLSFALETTGFRIQNGGSPPPRMESSGKCLPLFPDDVMERQLVM